MSGGPTVSVIVPTYNRAELLPRAIETALAQTFGDLEVVVVDDGSSDGTAAVVAAHADPRVRLVRHELNRGLAEARNSGIAAAAARYLAFLDDDDLWLREKLERQVHLLDRGAAVVHTLVYVADADGNILEQPSTRGFRLFREVAAAGYPYHWLLRRSSFQINSFAVRRDCIDVVGGFDETLGPVADLDFVHRLRRRYEFVLIDEPLVKYCMHGRNTPGAALAEDWQRLVQKELTQLRRSGGGHSRSVEAFLRMRAAQSAYVLGAYRRAVVPALRAFLLDRSVITGRELGKYLLAGLLPRALTNRVRASTRRHRATRARDPWIDLG